MKLINPLTAADDQGRESVAIPITEEADLDDQRSRDQVEKLHCKDYQHCSGVLQHPEDIGVADPDIWTRRFPNELYQAVHGNVGDARDIWAPKARQRSTTG